MKQHFYEWFEIKGEIRIEEWGLIDCKRHLITLNLIRIKALNSLRICAPKHEHRTKTA